MGRYITGDIDHKLWFGVQASDDANYFGVNGQYPEHLEYYFDEEDLDKVEAGVKQCKKVLGKNKAKLDKFFEKHNGYNDAMLEQEGLNPELLEWYARLELGEKIKECLVKNKYCSFEAEL